MMRSIGLVYLALVTALAHDNGDCPAFRPWRDWSECLWFNHGGLDHFRQSWVDACDIMLNTSAMPPSPHIGDLPDACGHCSFKLRCRKREPSDGCSTIDVEKEVCHNEASVCRMPTLPVSNMGCSYDYMHHYLLQCANRDDLKEHERQTYRKMGNLLPHFHCQESDDGQACNCCCHPYEPNADGTACIEIDMPKCQHFDQGNDWSDKCIWFPLEDVREDIITHCGLDANMDKGRLKNIKIPESIASSIPGRCGYCSFKFKCQKRGIMSSDGKKECFPMQMQKKACGADDCETCADICEIPKVMDSCDVMEILHRLIGPSIRSTLKKLPHMMRMGLLSTVAQLPHGRCIEKNDKCYCCCHPYEPNSDGTACVVKDVCKTPGDLGIDVDLNLGDQSFFWL